MAVIRLAAAAAVFLLLPPSEASQRAAFSRSQSIDSDDKDETITVDKNVTAFLPTDEEKAVLPDSFVQSLEQVEALLKEKPDFAVDFAKDGFRGILDAVQLFADQLDGAVSFFDEWEKDKTGLLPVETIHSLGFVRTQFEEARVQTEEVIQNLTQALHMEESLGMAEAYISTLGKVDIGGVDARNPDEDEDEEIVMDAKHYVKQSRKIHNGMGPMPHMVRQHMEMHEAIATGDTSFVQRMIKNAQRDRLQGTMGNNEDERRRLQQTRKDQCKRLVGCIQEWSLYDMVAWYYGPYTDDQGKLEKKDSMKVFEVAGDAGVSSQKSEISKHIAATIRSDYEDGHCRSLLALFHTNENMDEYAIYHGGAINMICRAQGTTKYMKVEEIREKIGPKTADLIFEDLVTCSAYLGDDTYFDQHGNPRMPMGILYDKHGYPKSNAASGLYDYHDTGALTSATRKDGEAKIDYKTLKAKAPNCISKVNNYYMKLYRAQESAAFKSGNQVQDVSYPPLQLIVSHTMRRLFIGVGSDAGKALLLCEVTDRHWEKCPNDPDKNAWNDAFWHCRTNAEFSKYQFNVHGLFGGFKSGARDGAVKLSLGDKMPVGLACAFAEKAARNKEKAAKNNQQEYEKFPGYCCMDQPMDSMVWGQEYPCDQGKDKCNTLAGGLAGLSQSACDVWSGQWCPYPRDCAELKTCIDTEKDWAKKQTPVKFGYLDYLENSPNITDTLNQAQCGDVREYFGFKADYPLDDEICEDVKELRTQRHFDDLDKAFGSASKTSVGGGGSSGSSSGPTQQAPLVAPGKHPLPFEAFLTFYIVQMTLGGIRGGLWVMEKIYIASKCPADCTGVAQTACAVANNLSYTFVVSASFTLDKIMEFLKNQEPVPKGWHRWESYYQIQRLYDNMVIVNDGIQLTLDDIHTKCGSRRQLELESLSSTAKFSGCDGLDQDEDGVADNCEEDFTPPELVVPTELKAFSVDEEGFQAHEQVFKSAKLATSYLHKNLDITDDCASSSSLELKISMTSDDSDCTSTMRATPLQWCSGIASAGSAMDFKLAIDTTPPIVECSFDASQSLAHKGKTLLLEEGEDDGLVNTGFNCKVEDACSESVQVTVSVASNEYDGTDMATTLELKTGFELWVAPSSCASKRSKGHKGLCSNKGGTSRFYEIVVTATDAAGWTSQDTSHIVVIPTSGALDEKESRSLNVLEMKPYSADYKIGETSHVWNQR